MPKETKEMKINKKTKKNKSLSSKEITIVGGSKKAKTVSKTSTSKKAAKTAKTSSSRNNTRKTVQSKKNTNFSNKTKNYVEYYDLPYRYNETIIRILFQTPKTLFVYWDISDKDKKNFIKLYGENFFNDTVPFLLVNNKTKNYSFELEISDFANSWYFNVNDANCEYSVELFRRSKINASINIPNNTIFITSSNPIITPNNHILFEPTNKLVYFRNIKNNDILEKNIANLQYVQYIEKIYNIYDLYKKIYKNEEILNLENLSSSNPTSTFN